MAFTRNDDDDKSSVVSSSTSLLRSVLFVHRFVALSFGLIMLLRPDRAIAVNLQSPLSDPSRGITPSEDVIMRCWGCFVIAVSYVVHSAAIAPATAGGEEFRRAVGRALCGCFGVGAVLVGLAAARPDPSWGVEERDGHRVLCAIFAGLSGAYGAGLMAAK